MSALPHHDHQENQARLFVRGSVIPKKLSNHAAAAHARRQCDQPQAAMTAGAAARAGRRTS